MGLLLKRAIWMSRYLRNYFKNKEECINYFKRLWDDNNGDEQLKEAEANGTKEIRLYYDYFDAPPHDFIKIMMNQLGNEVYDFFIWHDCGFDFKTEKALIIISWRDPYEITKKAIKNIKKWQRNDIYKDEPEDDILDYGYNRASLMYLESKGRDDEYEY